MYGSEELNNARKRLSEFISVPAKTLKTAKREIKVHDISTTRDLIISVDRFYELFKAIEELAYSSRASRSIVEQT